MNKIHGVATAGVAFAALTTLNALAATAEPDIVYLNRCSGGCSVQPGPDDAINGTSGLFGASKTLAAFAFADAVFDATAACVRSTLEPYNVLVRISSPGAVARREIMISGSDSQSIIGISSVSQDAPLDGQSHPNTIGVVFGGTIGSDVNALCWRAAQTVGNLYGLGFVGACGDIMGNATCGLKIFTNQDATCTFGPCFNNGALQNSDAVLAAAPGASDIVFENGLEAFQQPSSGPAP